MNALKKLAIQNPDINHKKPNNRTKSNQPEQQSNNKLSKEEKELLLDVFGMNEGKFTGRSTKSNLMKSSKKN